MPSTTPPCTRFSACSGLMIWLPMSPATHTLLTLIRLLESTRHLGDFGEVAAVAVLEADTHARCPSAASCPTRLLGHQLHARRHARRRRSRPRRVSGAGYACVREQVEPELHRILPRRVRQFVDERLEHERVRVAARRAQRTGRHAERHLRVAEVEVLDEERRELVAGDVRRTGAYRWSRLAERHEVIPPRDQLPVASTPPLR